MKSGYNQDKYSLLQLRHCGVGHLIQIDIIHPSGLLQVDTTGKPCSILGMTILSSFFKVCSTSRAGLVNIDGRLSSRRGTVSSGSRGCGGTGDSVRAGPALPDELFGFICFPLQSGDVFCLGPSEEYDLEISRDISSGNRRFHSLCALCQHGLRRSVPADGDRRFMKTDAGYQVSSALRCMIPEILFGGSDALYINGSQTGYLSAEFKACLGQLGVKPPVSFTECGDSGVPESVSLDSTDLRMRHS